MRVISIGTDRRLFEVGSSVRERTSKYGALFKELHIVVFMLGAGYQKEQVLTNVWLYPTASKTRWHYVFDAYRLVKKILRNWKLEIGNPHNNVVITCQDPFETGLVGFWLSLRYGIPLHIQIHTDFLSPHFRRSHWLNKIRLLLARIILPRAKNIRVVSERIKNSLVKHFRIPAQKIDVLPITLSLTDSRNPKPAPKLFPFTIMLASRFTKEKDIPTALVALKQITSSYPHVGMVIVGEGPEKKNYEKIIGQLGLEKSVKFIPWQSNLTAYYRSADVFLLTSLYEGFGMTLVEVALSNCPIVTTDVGLIGSVLRSGQEVLVCPVGESNCLAKEIIKLIEEPELRINLSGRAKTAVNHWVLPETKYLQAYKASLEKATK